MSGEKLYIWRCPRCGMNMSASWGVEEEGYGNDHGHYHSDEPRRARSAYFVHAEKVEVVPVEAPNVLSVEEADAVLDYIEGSGREEIQRLFRRLQDWAQEQADA